MHARYQWFALTLCLGLLLTGCKPSRKTIVPNTGQVLLKVWVVLGPGESIGGSSNKGCRLSQNDIQAFVAQLRSNGSIYGSNTQFIWNPAQISPAQDPSLLPYQPRTRIYQQFQQNVILSYWTAGKLNVYFTGDVQLTSSGGTALGMTLDPQACQSHTVDSPWILINDGQPSGGFTTPPSVMRAGHVLEHEMDHYLARLTNRTFTVPPPSRTYDSTEHVPPGQNNLLVPYIPHPLTIPGRANQAATEKKEIWDRIWDGNWNSP